MDSILSSPNRMVALKNIEYRHDFTKPLGSPRAPNPFRLESERMSAKFHDAISCRMADLLDVALSVYAADRQSRRSSDGTGTGNRRIVVRMSVREPAFWRRPETAARLHNYLYWLGEDDWDFEFVRRQSELNVAESRQYLFNSPPNPPTSVSLFSGGLDSLAGLVAHNQSEPAGSHVLVSGYSNSRLAGQQRKQVDSIKEKSTSFAIPPAEIHHLALPYGLCHVTACKEEGTQRTRAFVFLAFGTIAALKARTNTLWVYENGVGAMNLPLSAMQLGVDNYRGVHPRSLMKAQDLFEHVLGDRVEIRNPYLFHTKAEMCRSLPSSGLLGLVRESVSCDSYPIHLLNRPQCGRCTSCILRRQALYCGGLSEYDTSNEYQYDVLDGRHDMNADHLFELEVMRGQVLKLRSCLSADDPWIALATIYPELLRTGDELEATGRLQRGEAASGFVRLYQAYVDEWDSFSARIAASNQGGSREAA